MKAQEMEKVNGPGDAVARRERPRQEADPLLGDLNGEQRRAVTHDGGPMLIIAGAGTGKTTVISRRIAWLIRTGRAKPEEILVLTFTEKASGEMVERVDQLLPLGYTDLWISTFHAFCRRVLEDHGLDIGLPNDFRLLDQTDAYLLVRRNLDRFRLDYYRPLGNPTKFLHAMLRHFSRAKDEDISPAEYLRYAEELALDKDAAATEGMAEHTRLRELADAYHVYQQLLLEEGSLDLGDLQTYAIKLFRERPHILAEYRKKFSHVLVDEFQDTNWAQYALIKMLAPPSGGDKFGNRGAITVVGDDDQSIYKFRGASVSNILQFTKDFPAAKEVVLATNYRSRQGILDLAYAFIQRNNPNRLEAKLATADGRPMTKRLVGMREGEAAIEHLRFASHDDEIAGVADKIIAIKESDSERGWSDFCILVRSNSGADDYSRELHRRGIPYQFLALRGLYAKPIIMDCVAYFSLIDDHHESRALYRMLSSPAYAIPGEDLVRLAHEAKKSATSLYEVLARRDALSWLSKDARTQIERLLADIATHTQLARTKRVSQLLVAYLTDSGAMKTIQSGDESWAREQFGYLRQFLDRLKRFEESHDEPSLHLFMEEFMIERESGEEGSLSFDPDTGPDMVRIMTVHASKGLEFPYVFIVDLVDKRFPTVARGGEIMLPDALTKEIIPEGNDIHLEEERRLFYVAVTRAKDGVFLTSAEDYGGKQKKKPSRFLTETGLDTVPQLAPNADRLREPKEAPQAESGPLPLPPYFSFTQLAAYDTCPLQYKYAHVIRVPSLGKGQQSFGKTMHAALEWFLRTLMERDAAEQGTLFGAGATKAGLKVSKMELLAKYDEVWIDDWYESHEDKERHREDGRAMLSRFYDQCVLKLPQPKFLEQEFSLKFGEHVLKGAIDRIDDADGGVEIIDYKTGAPKAEGDLDSDAKRQLYLYQIAVSRLLGLMPVKLTYNYLRDGSSASFIGNEKQLAKLETGVEETFANITARKFDATPGRHCKFCDFKEICDFREA